MHDGIGRFYDVCSARLFFVGIQVAIEARKVATGNLQANPVPGQKHVTGRPQIHLHLIDRTRLQRLRLFLRIAVA